jgi:hypothetical protein
MGIDLLSYGSNVDVIVQRYVDYVDNPIVKLNGEIIQWNKTQK